MSQSEENNAYDTLPYPPYSFPATHVGRLAAIGRLFALNTASPENARVLELGCSSGVNLLAMAQAFPSAEFVGVDYSKKQIELANEALEATGITNAKFLNEDISKLSADLGEFDFIITHGIYSWVPAEVKEAILRISRENLKPHGVAYISYNCLPGWRMRGALRDMMLMHTAGIEEISGKVAQSKALIKFLAESCSEETPYGKYLRQELDLLSKVDDSYIAHDFLEVDNDALYFTDFLKAAARHNLAYLGDAEPSTMIVDNMPGSAAQTLKALNLNLLATEQYMDFVRNRMFRSTLLCRAENQLNRAIDPDCLLPFHATPLVALKQAFSPTQPAIFVGAGGTELTVGDAFTADIFSLAIEHRGRIEVAKLLEEVVAKHSDKLEGKDPKAVRSDLGRILLNGYFKKMVDFTVGPASAAPATASAGKPLSFPLARWQAARGHRVSSPRLDMLTADPFVAKFITLCDGTRDREALISAMVEAHDKKEYQLNENNQPVTDPERAKFIIERLYDGSLQNLENLGLLLPKAA
jgi:methyltransferase-like protein/ubiquinone/menaquinone biosynthesis C-methylase UbiE